jgi:hypothetical protein
MTQFQRIQVGCSRVVRSLLGAEYLFTESFGQEYVRACSGLDLDFEKFILEFESHRSKGDWRFDHQTYIVEFKGEGKIFYISCTDTGFLKTKTAFLAISEVK